MTKLLDQFTGCMVGALVGDCLGANFEFITENMVPKEKIEKYFTMIKNPEFSKTQKYTDDTAMARQIAKSIIRHKKFDHKDVADRFADKYFREPWRGYGGSVVEVFEKLKQDSSDPFHPASQQFNGSGSYGNGAGMRAHPVALGAYGLDTENIILNAANIGKITHSHVYGVAGGVLQTLAVSQALTAESPEKILENVRRDVKSFENQHNNSDFSLKLDQVKEYLDKPDDDLDEISFELGNNVTAIESVPTALYCFLRCARRYDKTSQFEETIRLAIHFGGDTDTIASMAGAISGAYLGYQGIPAYMAKHCEGLEQSKQHGEEIYKIVTKNLQGDEPPEKKAKV